MGEQAVSFAKKLETDEAFKGKWEDMLAAGGDDVQQIFAPMAERAAKKARAGPYGEKPAEKQSS